MATGIPIAVLTPARPEQPPQLDDRRGQQLAAYWKALGQRHRLRIFKMLLESEQCVCDLETCLGVPASLLAHHLKVLRQAGLVQVRRGVRDARWLYYSVNPAAFAELRKLVAPLFPQGGLPPEARCGSNCRCG